MDVLPEVWTDMMSLEERRQHYKVWSEQKQPAIDAAESKRALNGLSIVRNDDDLMKITYDELPACAARLQPGYLINANDTIVKVKDIADVGGAPGRMATMITCTTPLARKTTSTISPSPGALPARRSIGRKNGRPTILKEGAEIIIAIGVKSNI